LKRKELFQAAMDNAARITAQGGRDDHVGVCTSINTTEQQQQAVNDIAQSAVQGLKLDGSRLERTNSVPSKIKAFDCESPAGNEQATVK
jgi:hypothetical protein